MPILLAEHRLERCLAAADRVIAMDSGAICFDGCPRDFLAWSQISDPALSTPAARLFALAGIDPLPVGVRDARTILARAASVRGSRRGARRALDRYRQAKRADDRARRAGRRQAGKQAISVPALLSRDLWVELAVAEDRRDVLRGIDLRLEPGGTCGADGSKRRRQEHPAEDGSGSGGLARGKIEAPGGIALLTQNPSDYLVRERVGAELVGAEGLAALALVGLEHAIEADPRDLSGGERQRLALAIALAGRIEGEQVPGAGGAG